MKKAQVVVSVLFLVLLLVACAPKAVQTPAPALQPQASPPAPAPAPVAAVPAAPARPAWETEWEKVVEAARGEGRLVLMTGLGGEQRQIVIKPFESQYGVRVESMTGGSAELDTKTLAEQRAGIYSRDVFLHGSTSYLNLKSKGALNSPEPLLILPELTQPELIKKTWYFGEVPWADKAHTALIGLMVFQQVIMSNTNLVKAEEITTYRDLLNPKWKGKISLQDPRILSMGTMWVAVALENGDVDVNFMRELATKQELFMTRDRRLQLEWLAQGKHAITIAPQTATATQFIEMGAPVRRFNLGTPFVSGSSSGIAMMKSPPHPNAAKLFINWLLSREGGLVLSRAVGGQSQRLDVPTDHLDPSGVLKPGVKVFRADNEEFGIKRQTYYIDLSKEIFPQ